MSKLLAIAGAIVAAGLVIVVVLTAVRVSGQAAELRALQHSSQPAHLQQQITSLRSQVTTLSTQLAGEHRDVITCGDLQALGLSDAWGVSLSENSSFQISASLESSPYQLPSHCINS